MASPLPSAPTVPTITPMPKLQPVNGFILVQREPPKLFSASGLKYPEPVQSDYFDVVRVSENVENGVKAGMKVIFVPGAAAIRVPEVEPAAYFIPEEAVIAYRLA